eukprot:TRINITY_DN2351_c0_g1_i1.p1 TRINITY_DN2351_c0_g1~~TRINITY_DN2351_c0_g1_i1.p1  ORF type:complete len:620 (-),score=205.04 TRINITY_DN2351_c0_g1_i1:31-1890(-)
MSKKVVNAVLVGAGRIGKSHLKHLLRIQEEGEVCMKYIIEPFAQGRKEIEATYPQLKVVASFEEVQNPEEIHAVFICSPTHNHKDNVFEAVKRKWHVFCEKPIAFTKDEMQECFDVCSNAGLQLTSGWMKRFDPDNLKVWEKFQEDKPLAISITGRDYPCPPDEALVRLGSLSDDFSIHDINLALWLMDGELPLEVMAFGSKTFGTSVVDFGHYILEFKNGRVVHLSSSRFSPNGFEHRVEGVGKKGVYSSEILKENPDSFLKRWQQGYYQELQAFVRSIATGNIQLGDYQGNIGTALVCEALRRSYYEKRKVPLLPTTKEAPIKLRSFGHGQFGTYMMSLAKKTGRFEVTGAPARNSQPPTVEEVAKDPSVQAIYVCTPDRLHNPHATLALINGKHVLCEKPLLGFRDVSVRAVSVGVQLMLDFQRRFDDAFLAARKAVQEKLEKVVKIEIESRDPVPYTVNTSNKDYVLHVLENSCVHDFDMAQWLFEDLPYLFHVNEVQVVGNKYCDLHLKLTATKKKATHSIPIEINYSKESKQYVQRVVVHVQTDAGVEKIQFGEDISPELNANFCQRYETAYLRLWNAFADVIATGRPEQKGYETTFQILEDAQNIASQQIKN